MKDYFTVNELAMRIGMNRKVVLSLAKQNGVLEEDERGEEIVSIRFFMNALPNNITGEASARTIEKMNLLSLRNSFHSKVTRALKKNQSCSACESILGYTMADLRRRLEKTIPVGFTWQDFVEGRLHLDHIIPGCAFNVDSTDSLQFKRLWALKNLQLLTALEHRKKGRKILQPFQMGLNLLNLKGGISEGDHRTIS